MSTLLLDDAFKPVTPLTNGVINETLWQFSHSVTLATPLRCGKIFSDCIIANFFADSDSEAISKIDKVNKVEVYKNGANFGGHAVFKHTTNIYAA